MDGVGTPIIGRPRPLPRHDTPNPAYHPHTLNYEEPENVAAYVLDTPSGVGSNEGRLSERIAKINEVIAMSSFCSLAVAQGLDAASNAFAQADDQAAAEIAAVREYLDSLDAR